MWHIAWSCEGGWSPLGHANIIIIIILTIGDNIIHAIIQTIKQFGSGSTKYFANLSYLSN